MTSNPLDHSYLLDIHLTVRNELANKFYDASEIGGYKNKRLTHTINQTNLVTPYAVAMAP